MEIDRAMLVPPETFECGYDTCEIDFLDCADDGGRFAIAKISIVSE